MIGGRLAARLLAGVLAAALPVATLPGTSLAAPAYTPPMTSYGQPDLQGTWTNATLTTFERAPAYGARQALTPEEVAKLEGDATNARAEGNKPTPPGTRVTDLPYSCGGGFTGVGCGYNAGWVDPGSTVMRVGGEPRSSFITTTPDGRIPAFKAGVTPTGFFFRRGGPGGGPSPAVIAAYMAHRMENPETMTLGERCLLSFGASAGPVMLPLLYNNNYEIVQSRDSVAILVEMVHDVRIVHIGAQHRTDGVRPWFGDSIGHYEGNTLVVETTNYPKAQSLYGSWEHLKVTERFTRVGPRRVLYQFSVEDPTMWDQPWGGEYEFGASSGIVYEYACHEGNYALEDMLAGARADEAAAAAKAAAPATPSPAPAPAVK